MTKQLLISPFVLPPHPLAQEAAQEVIERVHAYMCAHPTSELHRQGKMFGVLVYNPHHSSFTSPLYIAAFSAKLDGSYFHEGFVPPVYEMPAPPVGTSRAESQRLQRLLFANYRFTNLQGETKNLLDIFTDEKPILSPEEYFDKSSIINSSIEPLPPSGAGDCCAPKLLQYALTHGLQPLALAEFWVGAPSKTDIRREGAFYPPCSGRCKPILRWMLGDELTNDRMNELMNERWKIDILYEDEWLMVINKPTGLLSVPGKTDEPSVVEILNHQSPIPSDRALLGQRIANHQFLQPVHRLDQDTSGLMVLAKTPDVYKSLQSYFQRRDILKRYEAVLVPNQRSKIKDLKSEGLINLPLLPNPYDRPRQMVNFEHGKPAITRYVIREQRSDGSLFVDFYPLTGRTHQLRVHAAHPDGLNAPILGDRLYSPITNRLYLHAAEIQFAHPVTQKTMHFCIPSGFEKHVVSNQ